MGRYINIGNAGFQRARNSEYVDKSGLIAAVNGTLFTERCFSCVTRCRRFGKSMAAKIEEETIEEKATKETRWSGFVRTLLLLMVIMAGAPQAAGQELTPYASNAVNFYFLNADGEYVAYCSNSSFSLPDRVTLAVPAELKRDNYCSGYTISETANGSAYGSATYTMTADKTFYVSYTTNSAWTDLTTGEKFWKEDGDN